MESSPPLRGGSPAAERRATLEFERFRPGALHQEDLAVADTARAGGTGDALGHFLDAIVADPDADLDLGQKRQAVFAAYVAVEIALLSAVTFRFADDAGSDPKLREGF